MTIQELIEICSQHPFILLLCFIAIPALIPLLGYIHGRENGHLSPWKYVYSVLVYAVCLPGILAAVLTAYGLFMIRQNLLEANLLVYFLPIISMIVTLFLIRQKVQFDDIPGFDRLSGLMVMIAITFILVLGIQKTRIWLIFGGSFTSLILLVAVLFTLLKWGAHMFFRKKGVPGEDDIEI